MSDELEPSQQMDFDRPNVEPASDNPIVKALPLIVPEIVLHQNAEKKRIKRSILAEIEERIVFEIILYLPYLAFSYNYPTRKGLFSKTVVQGEGRSVLLALREVDFGFYPELISLTNQLQKLEGEHDLIIQGVDSTVLVDERLNELKVTLAGYDKELELLTSRYNSMAKADPTRQEIRENIEHLKNTRETRWKMFADGLKLPSRIELEKLQLVEGNLFYVPYFMVRFDGGSEARFLVWDREGKENEHIADELAKNGRFRELVQSYARKDMISSRISTDDFSEQVQRSSQGQYSN